MAMTYGYVYVAQVALGADMNQCIKAIKEAEAYKGPSLIIAYAPCINHGIKKGMGFSQIEAKKAVQNGYWHLYRYNPDVEAAGKNGFTLDYEGFPKGDLKDFLLGEVRYASIAESLPRNRQNSSTNVPEKDMKDRLDSYKELAKR